MPGFKGWDGKNDHIRKQEKKIPKAVQKKEEPRRRTLSIGGSLTLTAREWFTPRRGTP